MATCQHRQRHLSDFSFGDQFEQRQYDARLENSQEIQSIQVTWTKIGSSNAYYGKLSCADLELSGTDTSDKKGRCHLSWELKQKNDDDENFKPWEHYTLDTSSKVAPAGIRGELHDIGPFARLWSAMSRRQSLTAPSPHLLSRLTSLPVIVETMTERSPPRDRRLESVILPGGYKTDQASQEDIHSSSPNTSRASRTVFTLHIEFL
ncbi:hypothetical protein RRG08_023864 [Elysia crispata]|uniref:Uncharacterized protein n=1 Tax=Elysia crispata TaxID=231223 RepID=A0AAE1E4B9_9GAST|nr:hypothetical protein RRG08_023864 [Elysia crispata]